MLLKKRGKRHAICSLTRVQGRLGCHAKEHALPIPFWCYDGQLSDTGLAGAIGGLGSYRAGEVYAPTSPEMIPGVV